MSALTLAMIRADFVPLKSSPSAQSVSSPAVAAARAATATRRRNSIGSIFVESARSKNRNAFVSCRTSVFSLDAEAGVGLWSEYFELFVALMPLTDKTTSALDRPRVGFVQGTPRLAARAVKAVAAACARRDAGFAEASSFAFASFRGGASKVTLFVSVKNGDCGSALCGLAELECVPRSFHRFAVAPDAGVHVRRVVISSCFAKRPLPGRAVPGRTPGGGFN